MNKRERPSWRAASTLIAGKKHWSNRTGEREFAVANDVQCAAVASLRTVKLDNSLVPHAKEVSVEGLNHSAAEAFANIFSNADLLNGPTPTVETVYGVAKGTKITMQWYPFVCFFLMKFGVGKEQCTELLQCQCKVPANQVKMVRACSGEHEA